MPHSDSESQAFSSDSQKEAAAEQRATTRAAFVIGFWTTLSRILGFVRDMVIALFMGAGPGADAFFVAFRIPNLLRRLFGEGALTAAFIPTYVDTLQREGPHRAERLARSAFTATALILVVVTMAGIVFSPAIVTAIAPGFADTTAKFELTVNLNRLMFPYILFVSLVALASGILNSHGYFAAPAAAPVALNLSMITSVAVLGGLMGMAPYYALAWGVVAAGVLQFAMQIPFLEQAGIRLLPSFHFKDPALKAIGRLFVPAAAAGAVYQVNVFVGTVLASLLPTGSVSWLYYADRLVELPLGIFAIALGTAILPSMSRQAGRGDLAGLAGSVGFALRLIAFFTLPATAGLILLREPIVGVLFQRGAFSDADTVQTAYALMYYTCGLWAFSGLKVVNQAFFSLRDTKTPLRVSILAVAVNLAGGLLLMGPLRHGGLALATSAAAAVNLIILFVLLLRRLPTFPASEFINGLCRIAAATAVMIAFVAVVRPLGVWPLGLTVHNASVLAACIVGGALVFGVSAYLVGCAEVRSLIGMIARRGNDRA